jgi:hypothetical protein
MGAELRAAIPVLELATPQRRLRLGPAVEIVRDSTVVFIVRAFRHKTINPCLRKGSAKKQALAIPGSDASALAFDLLARSARQESRARKSARSGCLVDGRKQASVE